MSRSSARSPLPSVTGADTTARRFRLGAVAWYEAGWRVSRICTNLHPNSFNATAPNLKRLAVVSAPVTDGRGERADERLNAALGKALKMMQERVEERGFADND